MHNLNFGGVSYYNNTIYNSGVYGIFVQGTSSGTATLKNNIVDGAGTHLAFFNGVGKVSADNNLYFPDGAAAFNWGGTASTFAGWKARGTQDSHSLSTNPLFTNPGIADFTPQSASPAIGAVVF